MRSKIAFGFFIATALASTSCGRAPSSLLRVGQAPLYDFPLYVSTADGTGTIWKFDEKGTKEAFVTGLDDPRGIATDKYNNLWVVEGGQSRLVKINLSTKAITIVRSGLSNPSVVAIDSFGDAYVNQEAANNILRASDGKIMATFSSRPTAIAYGVNDIPVFGLYDSSQVVWGLDQTSKANVVEPVMIATDGTGRVYVAQGSASNGRVYRFNQKSAEGQKVVADGLNGATGIAVDPAGNIYIAEAGAARIVLVTFDGKLYNWSDVVLPQYMAFTKY